MIRYLWLILIILLTSVINAEDTLSFATADTPIEQCKIVLNFKYDFE